MPAPHSPAEAACCQHDSRQVPTLAAWLRVSQVPDIPGLRGPRGRGRRAAVPAAYPVVTKSGWEPSGLLKVPRGHRSRCGILALLGFAVSPETTEGRLVTTRTAVPVAGEHLPNTCWRTRNPGRHRARLRGELRPLLGPRRRAELWLVREHRTQLGPPLPQQGPAGAGAEVPAAASESSPESKPLLRHEIFSERVSQPRVCGSSAGNRGPRLRRGRTRGCRSRPLGSVSPNRPIGPTHFHSESRRTGQGTQTTES